MAEISRRSFIRNASIGAAAAGTVAVSGVGLTGLGLAASEGPQAEPAVPAVEGPIVAYVTDLANGAVSVYHGLTETVIVDHNLARAIATAVK